MKISFAICTHNEGPSLDKLIQSLNSLNSNNEFTAEYEIVILDDYSTDEYTKLFLQSVETNFKYVKVFYHKLENDFSAHKNELIKYCGGEYIVNLDADEALHPNFLQLLPTLLESNSSAEAVWLPRINTVDGLTEEDVRRWKWPISKIENPELILCKVITSPFLDEYNFLKLRNFIIDEEYISEKEWKITYYSPIVAWPDPQCRIFKNIERIRWTKPVHEQLSGYDTFISLVPKTTEFLDFAIRHHKDILRQRVQNQFYERIMR